MRRTFVVLMGMAAIVAAVPTAATAAGNAYGVNPGGLLHPYDIGATGGLTPKSPASVPVTAQAVVGAFTPDGRHLYVASGTSGTLSLFNVGVDGTLTAQNPPTQSTGGTGGLGVTVTPDGKSLYANNRASGTIAQFNVNPDGSLTAKTPATVTTAADPETLAVSPDGKSAYAANNSSQVVSQFDVAANGTLSPKSPATLPTSAGNLSITLSPNGRNAYVISGNNAVLQYDIDSSGHLVAKTPASLPATDAIWPAIAPDGRSLYVRTLTAINQYDVAANGALTAKSPASVPAPGSEATIAVAPDGRSVYTPDGGGGTMPQFDVGAGGTLSAKMPPPAPAAVGETGVAVRPNQPPSASFTANPGAAGSATSFDASGTTDPDSAVARYDWEFGDGTSASNAGAKPTHTYGSPGTYTVKLTATDEQGCSTTLVWDGVTALCNGGGSATTTRTVTVPAPAATVAPPRPPVVCCALPPSSDFKIVALTADRGGTITAVFDTQAAGAADASATTKVRPAVRTRKAKLAARRRKRKARTIAYGTGSASTAGAGRVTLRIFAGHTALTALRRLRKLHVSVAITFNAGGAPVTNTRSVTVKAPKKRKHRRR